MASSYGAGLRPALKNNVDMQLQTAFAEGNWLTVLRLADKRAKSSNDPYYEVVKICAESRLDSIADKSAAAAAVDSWVRNGIIPKDIESIDLLEWACAGAQAKLSYSETFGTLRLRWAKANPRDVAGVVSRLQECIVNWDLVNAQQIAIVLDKSSNSHDRRFMYWGILLTHMLSTSPQCPAAKQKIYGMLAQKQLEKAAELAEAHTQSTDAGPQSADRSLRDEEELILYFRVLAARGSLEDYVKSALSPHVGALRQLELGRKQTFLEILLHLETEGQWDAVFGLCRQALDITDGSNQISPVACDLRVWKSLISASQKQQNIQKACDETQMLLNTVLSAKSKRPPMDTKNLGLVLLDLVFSLPQPLLPKTADGAPSSLVEQLLIFIDANLDKSSVFGDVKGYVEKLSFAETRDLLQRLVKQDDADVLSKTFRTVLGCKLRYLLATCPHSLWPVLDSQAKSLPMCKFCSQKTSRNGCEHCFRSIATDSLNAYNQMSNDTDFVDKIPSLDKDPRIDLALVAITCLLRLAGIYKRTGKPGRSFISDVDISYFLQAVLLADIQLQKTPHDISLRLLLVQLYLLLGSGSCALQLWSPLGVKRTILDALAPLLYDRLSTVSPGSFHGERPLLEPLRSYYATVLKSPSAVKITDAFSQGSYSSILDMAEFNDRLHRSCTRAMAVTEERRIGRALGGKLEELSDVSIFSEYSNNAKFVNVTDYGSTLQLESSYAPGIAKVLSIGPGLSNVRAHLGLLAERYLDVITFKPPKEYKPSKSGDAAQRERIYILESLAFIESSFADFLHAPDTSSHLTAAEYSYYTILLLLSSLSGVSLLTSPTAPALPIFTASTSSLTTMLNTLRSSALPSPLSLSDSDAVLHTFTDMHSLSMLRDAAIAVKLTAAFITIYHERETARDRSGKTGLHKNVLSEMRSYKTLSAQILVDIKAHIKFSKDKLGEPGWLDRISGWGSGPHDTQNKSEDELSQAVVAAVGGTAEVEDWSSRLLDAWRETVKGWGMIQLE